MSPLPGRAAEADMGLVINPIRSPKSSVLTWGGRSEEPQEGTMPRTIRSGRGGFYVEAATDLGAARDEVPTLQHHDLDLLLYRKVFRPLVRPASLIVVEHPEGTQTCG
ncbi:hypothetical protein SBA2_1150003 [Acidobacteriia bacterium SbA2]|nr:hypothetical protein SBA2_1150003 [Acidobacteriia bacterium SbA2]